MEGFYSFSYFICLRFNGDLIWFILQDYIIKEIEQVLGSKREGLSLDVCKKLSYTEAVMMEVWRHRPVLPMGLPHRAAEVLSLTATES